MSSNSMQTYTNYVYSKLGVNVYLYAINQTVVMKSLEFIPSMVFSFIAISPKFASIWLT